MLAAFLFYKNSIKNICFLNPFFDSFMHHMSVENIEDRAAKQRSEYSPKFQRNFVKTKGWLFSTHGKVVLVMSVFTKGKAVNKVCLIPVESIRPNPNQPRKIFHEGELQSLAESISVNGLLQPISLRRESDGTYLLIAGERRFIACKKIGMKAIPSIICNVSADDAAVLALIENIQRSDLNFMEEAAAIQKLIQQLELTQEQAARRLGRSQSSVANKLRLLKLPHTVQILLVEAGLTERHARALLRLPEIQMEEAAAYMVQASLNVAQAEDFIDEIVMHNQTAQGNEGQVAAVVAGRNLLEQPAPDSTPDVQEEKKSIKKNGRKLLVVKDLRIFTNTISRAIETMKQAGIQAFSQTKEEDEFIEYVVRIPKESAYQKKIPEMSRA